MGGGNNFFKKNQLRAFSRKSTRGKRGQSGTNPPNKREKLKTCDCGICQKMNFGNVSRKIMRKTVYGQEERKGGTI